MAATNNPRVALLYPGDRAARDRSDPAESRFAALFAAFAAPASMPSRRSTTTTSPTRWRRSCGRVGGVLVWCNPIEGGRRRDRLDALLREVAQAGVFVSAHPDTILRLGTKDVLVETRDLPFGSDVHRVDSLAQLEAELPARLQRGARVLKQYRGHSGIGVWRVEAGRARWAVAAAEAAPRAARQRGRTRRPAGAAAAPGTVLRAGGRAAT